MVERRISEAAAAMAGELLSGDPQAMWSGARLDSRQITGGEIFFALPGEQSDGHDFLPQAIAAGAAMVVVHRDTRSPSANAADATDPAGGAAWVRVDDTYRGLHDLTRSIRAQVPRRLVAITGSAGKTTTKEILAAMLRRRFRTERSLGNLNNLYGFPLSLLNIRDDCEWMVAEMGMSTPGELRQVSLLGQPDAAVFTNVRPAHLENFRDLRGIADAKAGLLAGLKAGGLVVANADDPEVMHIVARHRAERPNGGSQIVLYGMEGDGSSLSAGAAPSVTASQPQPLAGGRPGSRFVLTASGEAVPVEMPLHGLYNIENCLAAAACAHSLGVELPEIASAVADLEPAPMRGAVHRWAGLTLVDDSYNSNPDAARQALTSARQLPGQRHIAILGDMLELGPQEPVFHRGVGQHAAKLGFTQVVGVGQRAREIVAAAAAEGAATEWLADAEQASRWATSSLQQSDLAAGDVVLVKGSRGIGLEVVVQALLAAGGAS